MNKRIGMYSSILNVVSITTFAIAMLVGSNFVSYIASMFIAFSFIPMICSYIHYSASNKKAAGYTALAFASIYAVFIFIVYFAQVTTVVLENLNEDIINLIDYQNFSLFFNYNLFGYGIMALATFFIGLTIEPSNTANKWLKNLLIIHGIFFFSGMILPMLGVFNTATQGADLIGVIILEFWCAYFIPIGILSFFNFKHRKNGDLKLSSEDSQK